MLSRQAATATTTGEEQLRIFTAMRSAPLREIRNSMSNSFIEDVGDEGSESAVQFATFSAHNAAAVHLLETVQANPRVACLKPVSVGADDTFAYFLSLPGPDEPGPAVGKWRLGAGHSALLSEKRVASCRVDFLLCPPGNSPGSKRARQSIESIHAVFYFHPDSGMLILRNVRSKPIIYLGGCVDGADLTLRGGVGSGSCVLFRERNYLRFGDYEFVLGFNLNLKHYEKFRAQRDLLIFLHNRGIHDGQIRPSQHLAPVPTQEHYTNGHVRVHRKLWEGKHRDLYCGVHLHTGKAIAIKKLRFAKGMLSRVRNEMRVANLFKGSCEHVLGLHDRWRAHCTLSPCRVDECKLAEHQDEYYSLPLAEYDFETMPWTELDFDGRLGYFHQTLLGLGKLHDKDVMHGRIRPRCLMILPGLRSTASVPDSPFHLPTRAAISPAVSADGYDKPADGYWVAPEVWASTAGSPYTDKADIWGLAASWLWAFTTPPKNSRIDKTAFASLLLTVEDRKTAGAYPGSFRDLLVQMLAWDPRDRPSVQEALAHRAWDSLRRKAEIQQELAKRDREDRIRGSGSGVKKVRVLSPELDK